MTTSVSGKISNLFLDFDNGTIDRELFYNAELHQLEQERVFARAWLFVGHESQIPNPDDYFVSRMGTESVILTRDHHGDIHVLLNTCRHRGMRICRYDEGNTTSFSCPYHGWSYSTDGTLVDVPGGLIGVPQFSTAYHSELKKDEWGLFTVPKMHNYKGAIFACWDENAPDFLDYVGGFKPYLDGLLDHRSGDPARSIVVGGVQKWRVPSNWKFSSENFAGDMYHGISHQSVELIGIGPGGRGQTRQGGARRGRNGAQTSMGITSFPALGHSARGAEPHFEEHYPFPLFNTPVGPSDDPAAVAAYFEEIYEQRKIKMKDQRVSWYGGNMFPNFSFHSQFPRTILISHPVSATEMEMWRWFLVDEDAPQAVVDLARHHFMRYSGPGGMTEQDDMENWNYAASASQGVIAKRLPYHYGQGLGHAGPSSVLEGAVVSDVTASEENARTLYRRWAQFMDAESWDELR